MTNCQQKGGALRGMAVHRFPGAGAPSVFFVFFARKKTRN